MSHGVFGQIVSVMLFLPFKYGFFDKNVDKCVYVWDKRPYCTAYIIKSFYVVFLNNASVISLFC